MPLPPNQKDYYSYPEVTAPTFSKWRSAGAKALVTGFVQSRSDGRVTFGCYVYDVEKGRELGRKGFVVGSGDWRRAAHKCSGLAYQAITGAPGMFDTRIAYVAESGVGDARIKRIAVMDSDGFNHRYLTAGRHDGADSAPVAERRRSSLSSATPAGSRRCGCSMSLRARSGRWCRTMRSASRRASRRTATRIAVLDDDRRQLRHLHRRRATAGCRGA